MFLDNLRSAWNPSPSKDICSELICTASLWKPAIGAFSYALHLGYILYSRSSWAGCLRAQWQRLLLKLV